MADYLSITEEILQLTRSMVEAAQASDWGKVQAQEELRQTMITKLGTGFRGVTAENKGEIAAKLEETAALNMRLVALGRKAQDELAKGIGELQRGRKANRAYNEA